MIRSKRLSFIMAHPRLVAAMGAMMCLLFLRPPLNSASVITRVDVAEQMGKILFTIERASGHISASYEHYPVGYSDLPENISPEVKGVVALGLMSGYPDHTFHPAEPMRMGELFTTWAALSKHLQALTNNSGFSNAISRTITMPSSLRWMRDDLASLAGIGLISLPFPKDFCFDRMVSDGDLRQLADATLEFFCQDQILICTIGDLTMIAIRKQAISSPRGDQPGENEVWSYSTDQKTWIDSNPDDLLRIPFDPPSKNVPSMKLSGYWPSVAGTFEKSQGIFSYRIPGYEPGHIELRKSINRVFLCRLTPEPPGKSLPVHAQAGTSQEAKEISLPSQTETIEPSGMVCNALTRSPLSGASLVVDGIVVTTDWKGEFRLPPLPRSSLKEFLIAAEGYQSLSIKHRVGHKNAPLQFFLKPYKSSLKGRIISAASGKPVTGVSAHFGSKTFTSDSSGRFESKATDPGYQEVALEAAGYLPSRELIFIEETPTTKLFKLQPQLN